MCTASESACIWRARTASGCGPPTRVSTTCWAKSTERETTPPRLDLAPRGHECPVQNVNAMRPEVRAEYESALGRVAGDGAFGRRLERFFTELRDPLVAVYGHDERFPAAWE